MTPLERFNQLGRAIADGVHRYLVALETNGRAAKREALEQNLSLAFPDDWTVLLATMDRFDRSSGERPSAYILQMWMRGTCRAEEVRALHSICPAAFRDIPPGSVLGKPARVILPKLAEALP